MSLKFTKKEDANKVYQELKKYFSQTKALSKMYKSEFEDEIAEFTNTSSKKYPYIMIMTSDHKGFDKKYQIVFTLDNYMH